MVFTYYQKHEVLYVEQHGKLLSKASCTLEEFNKLREQFGAIATWIVKE